MQPIIKEDVRILRPAEYEQLRASLTPHEAWKLDGLLLTGMRYVEAKRFQENPTWFDNGFINLPKGAMLKEKAKMQERTIRLSDLGRKRVPIFLKQEARLPSRQWWDPVIKQWGYDAGLETDGLCAKTTRKTWASWLVFYYSKEAKNVDRVIIAQSMGHDKETQTDHYLNMPFVDKDWTGMKPWLEGWI